MSEDIIIRQPEGTRTLALRESYLAICGGDKCEAHLLNANERWYAYKLKNRQQARHINKTAQAAGEAAEADEGLWVFMSASEWVSDLLGQYDEKTLRKKLASLVERGFLSTRTNPRLKWDRKPQWLFMRANVQAAVDAWAQGRVAPDLDPDPSDLPGIADKHDSGNDTGTIRENARMQTGTFPNQRGNFPESTRAFSRSNTTGIQHRDLSQESNTGGEYNVTDNARAELPASPVAELRPAPSTTTDRQAEPMKAPAPIPASEVAVLSPDGEAADAAITDEDLMALFGDGLEGGHETQTVTEVQEVPGGAAGPCGAQEGQEGASGPDAGPHDPEETRAALVPALGGHKRLNALMEETPPGLTAGARRGWITRVTPERAVELIEQGRTEAGAANPWTFIIRLLDREVGAQFDRRSASAAQGRGDAVQQPGAYLTAEERASQRAGLPEVVAGQVWLGRKTGQAYTVLEVTSQSVFVEDLGEYTLQQFHRLFRARE